MENGNHPGTAVQDPAWTELRTVLSSKFFTRAPNLARILAYVCEKHLQGESAAIKEYNVAVEALGRSQDFDPSRDSIVRVEVNRLRKRLREYYESEGADHVLRIVLPEGAYVPQFIRRNQEVALLELPGPVEVAAPVDVAAPSAPAGGRRFKLPALIVATLALLAVLATFVASKSQAPAAGTASRSESTPASAHGADSPEIRVLCGFTGDQYIDRFGRTWLGDRFFSGGGTFRRPDRQILRTLDPAMYLTSREGDFRYDVPLKPGTYELHLHFAETQFGQIFMESGGEGERQFRIAVNGKTLLSGFDVLSDAGGPNIANERVFKDIAPAADGMLHLEFRSSVNRAMLNGFEVLPAGPGKARPIRILAGSRFCYDKNNNLWGPDRYFSGGNTGTRSDSVQGTDEPGLYAGERWGHFSYAIPVPPGSYQIRLKFSERYFGLAGRPPAVAGSRVFDVYCNGATLLKDFDILKEAGAAGRAVDKTFVRIQPNPLGKLMLTFVPSRSYASLNAIEVLDQTP